MPLIHQITLGDRIPPFNRDCLESWQALGPRGFEVVTWTDRRAKDYLESCAFVEAAALYRRARNHGEASDILRIALTHGYGGLYVDWDVLLVDPDKFLAVMPDFGSSDCILLRDPHTKDPGFACTYDNSLFYMRKGHPLALDFIREMERSYSKDPVPATPYLTGPLALTSFLDSHAHYKAECRVVDTLDVYAFDYGDVIAETEDQAERREILRDRRTQDGAPAIHFWSHTWVPRQPWSRRVRERVSRILRKAIGTRS
jgi:hypothetical protein